eukprot:m.101486 g.101486  ORF g.101486 m.101486 type:complete len:494 (+) comp37130_c0_seq7:966-2447(+)
MFVFRRLVGVVAIALLVQGVLSLVLGEPRSHSCMRSCLRNRKNDSSVKCQALCSFFKAQDAADRQKRGGQWCPQARQFNPAQCNGSLCSNPTDDCSQLPMTHDDNSLVNVSYTITPGKDFTHLVQAITFTWSLPVNSTIFLKLKTITLRYGSISDNVYVCVKITDPKAKSCSLTLDMIDDMPQSLNSYPHKNLFDPGQTFLHEYQICPLPFSEKCLGQYKSLVFPSKTTFQTPFSVTETTHTTTDQKHVTKPASEQTAPAATDQTSPVPNGSTSTKSTWTIVGIVGGTSIGVILLAVVGFVVWKKCRTPSPDTSNNRNSEIKVPLASAEELSPNALTNCRSENVFVIYGTQDQHIAFQCRQIICQLRKNWSISASGVECNDQLVNGQAVTNWVEEKITGANSVLLVCSKEVKDLFDNSKNSKSSDVVKSCCFQLQSNFTSNRRQACKKVIPVVLSNQEKGYMPNLMGNQKLYDWSTEEEDLVRTIRNEPQYTL